MKSELFNQISFHDSEIKGYKKDDNNIILLIKDGWLPNTYFKVKLKNVKVEVMNNNKELISYTLERFNNIFKNGVGHRITHGMIDNYDNDKYYLKLFIYWPDNIILKNQNIIDEYVFDGFNVSLCNDYNDTGYLYIKFIMDDIDIVNF